MRTLFLLGILIALTVIATKRDDQTAMEAAAELGSKASNLVAGYDKPGSVSKILNKGKIKRKPNRKELPPLISHVESSPSINNVTPLLKEPEQKAGNRNEEKASPVVVKPETTEQRAHDVPEWIMPKPRKLAMPIIPAQPKATVEQHDIDADIAVQVAKVEPAGVDISRSYDMVKGYYENASRWLEEIK